jgi:hypothetical protein
MPTSTRNRLIWPDVSNPSPIKDGPQCDVEQKKTENNATSQENKLRHSHNKVPICSCYCAHNLPPFNPILTQIRPLSPYCLRKAVRILARPNRNIIWFKRYDVRLAGLYSFRFASGKTPAGDGCSGRKIPRYRLGESRFRNPPYAIITETEPVKSLLALTPRHERRDRYSVTLLLCQS